MKLAVYYIVKNEKKNLAKIRAVQESLTDNDIMLILDTGSDSENFIAMKGALESENTTILMTQQSQFRYDRARNEILKEVQLHDVDMALWVDADESLSSGWRSLLEGLKNFSAAYSFAYSYGSLHYHQVRLTPASNSDIHWKYPAHEVLSLPPHMPQFHLEDIIVSQPTKERVGTLVPLLRKGATEYDDHRAWYYLAREYYYDGDYAAALKALDECDRFEGAYDEYGAAILTFNCHTELGDLKSAELQLLNCIACYPDRPEAYALMAQFLYSNSEEDRYEYLYFARKALECPQSDMFDVYTCISAPLALLARIHLRLGDVKKAVELNASALAACPTATDLRDIMQWYIENYPEYFNGGGSESTDPK